MKRSLMVDKLTILALDYSRSRNLNISINDATGLSESMLSMVESMGMLPPINEDNVDNRDTDDKVYENAVIKFFHTWETEDS